MRSLASIILSATLIAGCVSIFARAEINLPIFLLILVMVSAFVGAGIVLLMPVVTLVRLRVSSPIVATGWIIAAGAALGLFLFELTQMGAGWGLMIGMGSGAFSALIWILFNPNSIARRST